MAATCWIMQPWWTSDLKCTRSARDRSRVPEVSHRSQTLWPELEVVSCLVAILHSHGWHTMTWCLTCPSCGVACTSIPVAETSPSQSIWSVFPVASFAMGAIDGHLWPQGHSTLMSIQRWTDGWENLCSVSWAWCGFNRRWHQIWICGMPSGWINHNHSPCGHDLRRATSVLFAQLAFWLDRARRLVDSLKRPSAMAEHAKLGVRLNRMGCVDGRKILENPYTSDNNPRYWKKTLCDLCASQVALDLFHGPVIFLLDNLFCVWRVQARGQGGK